MERLGETQKHQTNEFKPVLLNYIQVFSTKTMLLLLNTALDSSLQRTG